MFSEEAKDKNREEYIAVVTYTALTDVVVNFFDEYDEIISAVQTIENGNVRTGHSAALLKAEELLDGIDSECKKNIVNITKGINCAGSYSYVRKIK